MGSNFVVFFLIIGPSSAGQRRTQKPANNSANQRFFRLAASSRLNGGHLGPPSWISGFSKTTSINRPKSAQKYLKRIKTPQNDLIASKMLQESLCLILKQEKSKF